MRTVFCLLLLFKWDFLLMNFEVCGGKECFLVGFDVVFEVMGKTNKLSNRRNFWFRGGVRFKPVFGGS